MVKQLQAIAAEIRFLRQLGASSADFSSAQLALEVARDFQLFLDHFAEHEGMLTGEMPWWTERLSTSVHSPSSKLKSLGRRAGE